MAADAEAKISGALERELNTVERDCIRPLQARAFRCSARCCEDQSGSQTVLQACLQSCMRPVMEAEDRIKQDVQQLQDRLTRCARQCDDQARDNLPVNPSQQDIATAKSQTESCIVKCAESHSHLVPKIIAKYRASLDTCSS